MNNGHSRQAGMMSCYWVVCTCGLTCDYAAGQRKEAAYYAEQQGWKVIDNKWQCWHCRKDFDT